MVEDGEFQPVIAMADHFLVKKKKKQDKFQRKRKESMGLIKSGVEELDLWQMSARRENILSFFFFFFF